MECHNRFRAIALLDLEQKLRIRERHEDERYNVEDTWNAKSITKEWKSSAAHFKFLQNKRLRMEKFLHKMYESVTIAVLKLWLRTDAVFACQSSPSNRISYQNRSRCPVTSLLTCWAVLLRQKPLVLGQDRRP